VLTDNRKWALEGFTEAMAKEVHPDWNIKFLILEPGGTKTEFAKGSMVIAASHPAYTDPSSPTRQLEKYLADGESLKYWADPALVAKALFEVVGRNDMPLRLVTGADGYALIRGIEDARVKEVEQWKDLSESCSSMEQATKVAFLQEKAT
jgi:NAD(P)-dependent dehydrogenase (short-subunit alcohol dehydrogenase family)